jgi:hypothetical protein
MLHTSRNDHEVARAIGLHREIFFGGGNLTNSSPGRNRSGSSLGTPEYGLDTTLASGAGRDGTTGAGIGELRVGRDSRRIIIAVATVPIVIVPEG